MVRSTKNEFPRIHREPEEEVMRSSAKALDIPIGRVELFGLVLHIVEHDGRLVAACPDERGKVVAALTATDMSAKNCRRLMRSAVDLLLEAAERAFSESTSVPARCASRDAAARRPCGSTRSPPSSGRPF
jgi:hypothetical protein